eukprot:scaffold10380_cov41-Cyclotella_meneghiniana.AAC.1
MPLIKRMSGRMRVSPSGSADPGRRGVTESCRVLSSALSRSNSMVISARTVSGVTSLSKSS